MRTKHQKHNSLTRMAWQCLAALLATLALSTTAMAQNTLTVADFTAAAGKEAAVPIFLTNSDDVVALQFDIELPYAKSNSDVTLIASRSNGHTVSLRKRSNLAYTVVVMSLQNNAIRGNAGQLMRFPIAVNDEAQADDQLPVRLTNIVITDKQGHNIASETQSEATFTVLRTPTPDFIVEGLRMMNPANLVPGGKLQLTFNVANQGTGESTDGWTEKVYLEDATGYRAFVGSKNYTNTLAEGTSVPRTYEIDLPQVMKTEGEVRAVVELVPMKGSGELIADQGNNTATSSNTATLEKRLFLSQSRLLLEEGKSATVTLTRSGDWSMDETFTIAETSEGEGNMLSLPATVTIAAKQSAVNFTVRSLDNTEVNDQYRTGITVGGNDYPDVSMTVDVEDNDNWPLTLKTDKVIYEEGEQLTLTATITKARESDLKIDISNNATSRFYPYVRSITIPAGSTSATATTQVVDDDYPMANAQVTFTGTAQGYETARCVATVKDDDWPTLTIKVTPSDIPESGGYGAAKATITRTGNTRENVTIFVTSTSGEIYFDSNRNIIPAGQTSVTIPVSVMDNANIDGDRSATISAAACDAQTGKAATQGSLSYCTATVTINDDDSRQTLKLQGATATLNEGGASVTMTLTRNTSQGSCTVNLSSDDSLLEFPATVTIANGKTSATFSVKANRNTTEGDDHYSSITAKANGYQTATFTFLVTDQTLPQADCGAPTVAATAYGGQTVSTSIAITNNGTATLAKGMEMTFYLSTDQSIRHDYYYTSPMREIATVTTTNAVAAGSTVTMTYSLTLPDDMKEQQYYLFVWLNKDQKTEEQNAYHNPSATAPIMVKAPFTVASLTTDSENYTRGETIEISGQMSNSASGVSMDGKTVDVYLIDTAGNREVQTTTMDAQGRFTMSYQVGNLAGRYGVGACSHNAGSTDVKANVNVAALKIEPRFLKLTLTEGVAAEGTLQVTNLSANSMHSLTFRFIGLPQGWTTEVNKSVNTLAAGATTSVGYRIVPSTASESQQFEEALFRVRGLDGNKTVDAEIPVYHFAYAATCQLTTSAGDGIKTTISKASQRTMQLAVQNTGLRATGTITVECPTSQPWLTASVNQMASIDKDEEAVLTLTLTGSNDMVVDGTYESYVRLKPENGTAIVVPVKATVVGTEMTTLTVDVVDAYTLGAEDGEGPHVSGATVRLTNSLTNEVAMTGTTGDDGLFSTDMLKEGTYYVYVTAPNHYYTEKTITVNPGEENTLQVFLNYKAVNMNYTVEQTTVEDEYVVVLTMDVVPDIPQAIVVPTLPQNWGCGTNTFSIRLTNKGRLTAYNPYMEFPTIDGYTFTVKSEYPDVIYPNESYDVAVEFSGPEDKEESMVGGLRMHYSYQLKGDTYSTSETYAILVGCDNDFPFLLGGGGLSGDDNNMNLGDNDPDLNINLNIDGGQDEKGDTSMPNITVRDYTQTNHNSITLQFEQRFLLTREAFKGSLTIDNQQMEGIEDIQFVPSVQTTDGRDATDLFAVSTKVEGLNANDRWDIAASGSGQATALYVPAKEAAPTEPVDYLFGGTVTYRDVETGKLVTVELMKTKLTVNPSPDLHLTYFVERDFLSDDPLTEEVEPWQPAEFALLIQNKGAGPALDLKIETSEPTVVSNENNLPVTYTSLYTTLDGVEGNFPFNKLNLGRIEAGTSRMARWWFYTNVTSHVANYEVRMTKASNYGEEFNLITVDGVRELTHAVTGTVNADAPAGIVGRKGIGQAVNPSTNIFLLNLIEDADNMPDYVMDQNGNGTDDLETVGNSSSITAGTTDGEYVLTVNASRKGWTYGVLHDPTNCTMLLKKAIRQSDGADMTANFWQTDRTVTADYTIIVDNRLHWADNIGTEEQYVLTYEPKPANAPEVKHMELVLEEGMDENVAKKVLVVFAEPIDPETFGADDVVLMNDGQEKTVGVEMVDDTTAMIDLTASGIKGKCTLTVFTSGVKNAEGTAGTTSKSIEWNAESNLLGDADGNGIVSVSDVMATVSKILGFDPVVFIRRNADINADDSISVNDVMGIVGIVLQGNQQP